MQRGRTLSGDRIGPYRLIETLGSGGMGTVYLAEQHDPVVRRVALKLITVPLPTRRLLQRFELERQALARMSHPNIAQVLDAGTTEDGRPYLVMEHVEGEAITTYCDRHRLPIEKRLSLLCAACRGVHHAHQKGILHRDLKPGNVLVTEIEGAAIPKIIDFGIAKVLDEPLSDATRLTMGGWLLGTPAYLPPEAVLREHDEPDVDIRTDVYALGVLLYELTTGFLPHELTNTTLVETIDVICNSEPMPPSRRFATLDEETARRAARRRSTSPSALLRQLRGELDWITMRSIDRERNRRYDSAAALAADLERYQRREAVLAGPPSTIYRLGKILRRHRALVVSALLLVATLVWGIAARTIETRRATLAAELAQRETERARREAQSAREVSQFLVELFDTEEDKASQGTRVTARELLDRGAERIRNELTDQPLTRARLMEVMGRVYQSLGLAVPAETLLRGALEIRRVAPGVEPLELASSLVSLGVQLYSEGHYQEAGEVYRSALDIRLAELGEEHALTAAVIGHLGDLEEIQGRNPEAEVLLRRALAIRERVLGPRHADVAESYERLGIVVSHQGRDEDAIRLLERALSIRRAVLGSDHPKLAFSLNSLAIAYAQDGDDQRAGELFREALVLRRRVLGDRHPEVAQSLNNLAVLARSRGDDADAEPLFREALDIWTAAHGADHPRLAGPLLGLANIALDGGRLGEAERLFRSALDARSRAVDAGSSQLLGPLVGLGETLRRSGAAEEAESVLRRAVAIAEAHPEEARGAGSQAREQLVELLRAAGRDSEARSLERPTGNG